MTEFDTKNIDYAAIERRAHQLRAEAARDGFVAFKAWIVEKATAVFAVGGRHA